MFDQPAFRRVMAALGIVSLMAGFGVQTSLAAESARCDGEAATIAGPDGNDVLYGTDGRDVIAGLGGDDRILASGGNDLVCGGEGADTVQGDSGDDRLFGDGGDDLVVGGAGADEIFGNGGSDRLRGGDGDDRLDGGGGDDRLHSDPGADTLQGGSGADVIDGGEGDDIAEGGEGADRCGAETVSGCEDRLGADDGPDIVSAPALAGGRWAPAVALGDRLVPANGALFGSTGDYQRAEATDHFRSIEARVGRRLDVYHGYHRWDKAFPTPAENELADGGRILFLSWNPGGTPWAEIAAGAHDGHLAAQARRIADFGAPMFFAFHHEPEDEVGTNGSAADFAAATRRVREVFDREGATNAVWVWTVMGWSAHADKYDALYPGDDYVDWIGYDRYNWAGCRAGAGWMPPADVFGGWFYDWARSRHPAKPLMLAEFGLTEQPAGSPTKADWFDAAPAAMRQRPAIKAYLTFDTGAPAFCEWSTDSSESSAAAYGRLARQDFLNVLPTE